MGGYLGPREETTTRWTTCPRKQSEAGGGRARCWSCPLSNGPKHAVHTVLAVRPMTCRGPGHGLVTTAFGTASEITFRDATAPLDYIEGHTSLHDQNAQGNWWQKPRHDPQTNQHNPSTPISGLCKRENDTSRNTGYSGPQNAVTRRSMRREERLTVQGPIK